MAKKNRKKMDECSVTDPTCSPGFDVGFQVVAQAPLENALGTAAINVETLHDALQSQIESHLGKASANIGILQSVIGDQLYQQLNQQQKNIEGLQRSIDVATSARLGQALEQMATVMPQHPDIQALVGLMQPTQVASPAVSTIQPPTCAEVSIMTPTQITQQFGPQGVIHWVVASGPQQWGWSWSYTVLPSGAPAICVGPHGIGASQGLGFPSYCCEVAQETPGVSIPPIGTSPGMPSQPPTYQPPTQPQQPCQKICGPIDIKWPECLSVKFCDDKKITTPCKYCLYCTSDGVLYIIKDTDSPRNTNDTQLQCGDPKEWNLQKLIDQCSKKQTTPGGEIELPPQVDTGLPGVPQSGCGNLFLFQPFTSGLDPHFFRNGMMNWKADPDVSPDSLDLIGKARGMLHDVLADSIGGLLDWIISNAYAVNTTACSGNAISTGAIVGRVITSLVRHWMGDVVEGLDTSLMYAQNSGCPFRIPSSPAGIAAYLTNSIDLDRLQCILAANGDRWESWKALVDQGRNRWNPAETMMLWRRKFIDKPTRNEALRQLGYLNQADYDGLEKLTEQVPPVSDLISMMIRDAADEVNVDWTESDAIFKDKWTGQLKDWGYNQGIPDEYAKFVWRAHWTIPSPTQLALFWQRLRKSGRFGTEDEFLKTIKGALTQQDILPKWQDAYLETQFHPLTRVDAKRAYEVGVLDDSSLEKSFNDAGYSDTNAKILVDYTKKQLIEKYKRSPLVNKYAEGLISQPELDAELRALGLGSDVVVSVVQSAVNTLKYGRRKKCLAAIRKRFSLGEINQEETRQAILDQGLDPTQTDSILQGFVCEQKSISKFVPASTLCGWYERGVIDEVEMYSRLRNIGFNEDDATKMVRDCMIRNGIKLDKAQQQALAKAQRQAMQEARMQKQLAKQLQAQLDKAARQAATNQQRRIQRQKLLITAGENWAKKTGSDLADSVANLDTIVKKIAAANIAPLNIIYSALTEVSKDSNITSYDVALEEMISLLSAVDSP